MALGEWQYLRCECGGEIFQPVVKLKYKSEGGTISEPFGHTCVACHAVVDNAYMVRLVEMSKKRAERDRLNAELAEAERATAPKKAEAVATN